jgi:hypothetical protein
MKELTGVKGVNFKELTTTEQQLQNSFETDKIYRLLKGEPDTVPDSDSVPGGDATVEFIPDQAQSLQTGATSARPSPAATAVPPAKIKVLKPSTSARAALQSLSSSSSAPSMTPSSPTASTSGTVPKTAQTKSTSGSSATPSKSPSPTTMPKPAPMSAKGSGWKLRSRPDVNYQDLHLGRNLLLGRREFLKRCNSTGKTVGKAVQQTVQKVRKVAEEFPVISPLSSSSSTASSK